MNQRNERLNDFIRDLAYLLCERIKEAQEQTRTSYSDFEAGRELGLRQAVAWLQHQVDAFGIPRNEVGLDGFDALFEDSKDC